MNRHRVDVVDRPTRKQSKPATHFQERPWCDQQSLVLVLDYNRDTTPFEVEGNLVNLPVGVNVRVIVLQDGCVERIVSSALLDRLIQWITYARFVQAVQVGEQKDAFRWSAK